MIKNPEKYREHFKGNDKLFAAFENIVEVMNKPRETLRDFKNVAHFKAKDRL